jgi:hypothetical protein
MNLVLVVAQVGTNSFTFIYLLFLSRLVSLLEAKRILRDYKF